MNIMSRVCILLALVFLVSGGSLSAQDFSVAELMKLRTSSLSNFEDVVMGKGYELHNIDREYDHYVTFKKGHSTISYGYQKSAHYNDVDTVVIYITDKEAEYNVLKSGMKEDPKHPNKTHFFKNETHILHVPTGDGLVVHFFTKYNERPVYEVQVTTEDADWYGQ